MFENIKSKERTLRIAGGMAVTAGALAVAGCGGHGQAEKTVTETVATVESIPTVPVHSRGPGVLLRGSSHKEIVQFSSGSPTFGDYRHFSAPGPILPQGGVVETDCLVIDQNEIGDSTHGEWYHLIGPRALRGLYTPSDNFENGIDNPNAGPAADTKVPHCPPIK